jgi:hypothetical protein
MKLIDQVYENSVWDTVWDRSRDGGAANWCAVKTKLFMAHFVE